MKNRFTPLHRALLATALVTAANFSAQAQSVGIGTTAPDASAALDVVGTAMGTAKGALLPRLTSAQRTAIPSPATGLIVFQTDGTPGFYYNSGKPGAPVWDQIATAAGTAITATNGLTKTGQAIGLGGTLAAATTVAQDANFFALTGTGQIGLGTAAATGIGAHVTVQAAAVTEPGLQVGLSGASAAIAFKTEHNGSNFIVRPVSAGGTSTVIENTGGGALAINPTIGNVGVGTTTPQQLLDVSGSLSTATVGTLPLLRLTRPDNLNVKYANSLELALGSYGTNNSSQSQVDFKLANGNTDNPDVTVMSLQASGNVGVGTTTPTATLDVAGSTRLRGLTTAGLVQTDASGNLSSATAASLDPTTASNGLTKAGNDFRLGGTLAGATTIAQAGNAFSLTGGSVGIGTTAPAQKLDVVGNIQTSAGLVIDNAQTNAGGTLGNASGLHFGSAAAGEGIASKRTAGGNQFGLDFYTANSARLSIDVAGNFGIGTTAPAEKLDVVGNIESSANIAVDYNNANSGTVANTLHFGPTNSGEAIGSKRTTGGNQYGLDFYTVGTNRMAITPAGNVGIGTTTPATKLDVNGNLRLAVRLCPVNITITYTLTAADIAYSIFKLQDAAFASSITLPPAGTGQVEGQELTIVNAANPNNATMVNGTNTDNSTSVPLSGVDKVHAVKYVWVINTVGDGLWYKVQ